MKRVNEERVRKVAAQGRVAQTETPLDPDYEVEWTITAAGREALRLYPLMLAVQEAA